MNWIELMALNSLYRNRVVKLNETLLCSGVINYLINSLKVLEKNGKSIFALAEYDGIYENKYLNDFSKYESFLQLNDLLKPQTRLLETDIIILMNIKTWRDDGILKELRNQIIDSDASLRGVSLMFFKNEKYLDDKPSLVNALKQILDVSDFSNEKDQQYIYKLECINPVAIVLCENLDFLTKPNKPRKCGIELWYAGGKNINKLDFADTRGLPIFYSCDWDYDGLFIIYRLVKEKINSIKLLTPDGSKRGIEETGHNSIWRKDDTLNNLFNYDQKELIKTLQQNNQWIIEESNSLMVMLKEHALSFNNA